MGGYIAALFLFLFEYTKQAFFPGSATCSLSLLCCSSCCFFSSMAYKKGLIKDGYIGKCKYMFFDIWDVVSIYRKELETNPFKLYGLER